MSDYDVAIVGGGITGLSLGYYLQKNEHQTIVLEKDSRPGGVIRSERCGPFLFEHGPNSIMSSSPAIRKLVDRLSLNGERVPASEEARNRYVLRKGRLVRVPTGTVEFVQSDLLSLSGKLRGLAEPFVGRRSGQEPESIAHFANRRFGREVLDYLMNPFMAGVYAGVPGALSVDHTMETLRELEENYGSVLLGMIAKSFSTDTGENSESELSGMEEDGNGPSMFSFQNGLTTLPQKLAAELGSSFLSDHHVIELRYGSPADGEPIELTVETDGQTKKISARHLVLATPARVTAELLDWSNHRLTDHLENIPYAPLSVVFFGFSSWVKSNRPRGFGFLVPRVENRDILGTLFTSDVFPARAPDGGTALTTFVGGTRQPELTRLPEEDVVRLVQTELEDIFGLPGNPDLVRVHNWARAIPQYNLEHNRFLSALSSFEEDFPGITIAGNYRGGVSVPSRIQFARNTAEELTDHRLQRP